MLQRCDFGAQNGWQDLFGPEMGRQFSKAREFHCDARQHLLWA